MDTWHLSIVQFNWVNGSFHKRKELRFNPHATYVPTLIECFRYDKENHGLFEEK